MFVWSAVVGQHFKLTGQEFNNNVDLFKVLEIKAEQVIDKDYQGLSSFKKNNIEN